MENQIAKSVRMAETDYDDVVNGRCGPFQQEELQKLISECRIKKIPVYLTDEEGKIVKKIV